MKRKRKGSVDLVLFDFVKQALLCRHASVGTFRIVNDSCYRRVFYQLNLSVLYNSLLATSLFPYIFYGNSVTSIYNSSVNQKLKTRIPTPRCVFHVA